MPNWCSTAYAIEGNAKELTNLYELMKNLQEQKEPSVSNGFGTAWLGCLVDALGENWEKYIVVAVGTIFNLMARCLHSIQKQRGLLAMKCLIWCVRNIPHCDISINQKNQEWDCIVLMTRRASIFQTNSMLMYLFRRKNTIPSVFLIYRACMTGWRKFVMCKFGLFKMSMR